MIEIQLTGQSNPIFEYVKLALSVKLSQYGISAKIEEKINAGRGSAIPKATSLHLKNTQPCFVNSIEESPSVIQSFVDQLLLRADIASPIEIIVPIDMSVCSMNAANYAIKLGQLIHAPITLVHYHIPPVEFIDYDHPATIEIEAAHRKRFEHRIEELKSAYPSIADDRIKSIFSIKEFSQGIAEISESSKQPLIILGSSGDSNLIKTIFGSNTMNAIRISECPVLIIPKDYENHKFNNMSLALEHYTMNKQDLRFLEILSKRANIQLNLITVTEDNEDIEQWRAKIKSTVLKSALEVASITNRNVVKRLEEHIEMGNTDMLILTPKKRNVFESIFNKSVSKKMALNSKIPLLVINHQCRCKEGSNCCKINKQLIKSL